MRRTLFLVPLLMLAGCAGNNNGDDGVATAGGGATPSASAPAADRKADKVKFAQCMRDNGIAGFEDPDPDEDERSFTMHVPKGVSKDTVDNAMKACKQYMPNGGEPPKADPAMTAKLRKLSRCMRENGVPNFPDPAADGGIQLDSSQGIDPESAAFKAADEKCREFRPEPPGDGDGGNTKKQESGT